ncbi:MAG: hypothetical protein ABI369_04930 [Acetobacteraceae bacterium]
MEMTIESGFAPPQSSEGRLRAMAWRSVALSWRSTRHAPGGSDADGRAGRVLERIDERLEQEDGQQMSQDIGVWRSAR